MLSNLMESVESHLWLLYLVHIIISFILAIILTKYTAKRYVKDGEEIDARDRTRLEKIADKSILFKLLFRVSLHKNNRITSTLFVFLFNIAMPIIGYVLSLWVAWYLKNVTYEKKVTNTNMLNLDEFGMSFLKVERIFGEGSMSKLLQNKYAPKSKKLKALSALAGSASPANLRIIRQTLSSTDDEIRMFGYAIINKTEKTINGKINKYITLFNEENDKTEPDKAKRAKAAKELAFLYWEMIYTELSHESLRDNFLKEVVKYLNVAKEFYTNAMQKDYDTLQESEKCLGKNNEICTKLYVLSGRVYMYKKQYDNAVTEFTIAQELNTLHASHILPYLAEIYYLTGNYKIVNSIINQSSELGLNATLYPIVEQWKVAK